MGDDDGGGAAADDGASGGGARRDAARGPMEPRGPFASEALSIEVSVTTTFLESQSFPELSRYVWAYRVRIANHGDMPARLMRRYWRITDARGHVTEVSGEGVVGEQPVIAPGAIYEYASGAPLETPSGVMGGRYEMESGSGARFDVEIPTFSLDSPHDERTLN